MGHAVLSSPSHHGTEEAVHSGNQGTVQIPGYLLICSVACLSPFSPCVCFLTGKLHWTGGSHLRLHDRITWRFSFYYQCLVELIDGVRSQKNDCL